MSTVTLLNKTDLINAGVSLDDALGLVENAYRLQAAGQAEVPTKIGVHPPYPNSFLHAMPAWVGGEDPALGLKWVSYYPGNDQRGLSDSTGVIVLNDVDTGQPLSVMEGMHITLLRTAACAAVMARQFVDQPTSLGLIGCGGLGEWSLRVLCHVFPSIKTVYVSSRRASSRDAFCAQFARTGCELVPVAQPQDAIVNSDIVVSSVPPSNTPPITAGMLQPGQLFIPLDRVNAWENAVLGEFSSFVADNAADFPNAINRKLGGETTFSQRVYAFQDMLSEPESVRKRLLRQAEGSMYLGVCGIASVDMVLAKHFYQQAVSQGLGTDFQMC